MSHRSSENSRDYGRSRSSSSSSTTSTTSSSSSSPPTSRQRRRNRRSNRSRTRSRSRTSSASTRSRSPSNERRRGRYSDPMDSDSDNHVAADLRPSRRDKDQSSATAASHHESSPIDRHRKIDDSIRSDKSTSEAAEPNGRAVGASVSAAVAVAATTATVSATTKATVTGQAPTKRTISAAVQFGRPGTVVRPCIQMKLGQPKPPTEPTRKITVANAFNNDSDDEVEEMPPECKMRMRNIGRDTPTSSGPNSFGKTKQGFIDSKKLFEKSLREAALE